MTLEDRIHCGQVISLRATELGIFTESSYEAGSRLPAHAHTRRHLAVLLQGAYFERIDGHPYLRLPGDEVFYPEMMVHENQFGRVPSICMNVESHDGSVPLPQAATPEMERLRRLAADGATLKVLAREVGYHPVYLARLFRRLCGQSVGEFAKRSRVRKAAAAIFLTDLPLAEIALDAGYYDQSHCTNELAKVAGFTPGELRRLADS